MHLTMDNDTIDSLSKSHISDHTLFEMFLALSAYTRVFLLSSLCTSAGLMWAIITVWQLPFRVSFSSLEKLVTLIGVGNMVFAL